MKKLKFWSIIMLMAMSLALMVSCGGDDDSVTEPNNSEIIDGVYVPKGKKLVQLKYEANNEVNLAINAFIVKYDSKGRLSQINIKNKSNTEEKEGEEFELAKIDYDTQTISNSWSSKKYHFSLNSNGYISQIGFCTLDYTPNGYLKEVNDNRGIGSIIYNEDDIIKASVSKLTSDNISLYYFYYGEDLEKGEMIFNMERDPLFRNFRLVDWSSSFTEIICGIAYTSGLFGKNVKRCITLKDSNKDAVFTYNQLEGPSYNMKEKECIYRFICEWR